MAQRRMINIKLVDTDNFLEMPQTAQCLYFHLLTRADDDGFVDAVKKVMRILGNTDDDLKILIAKRYIIPFQSGVCVIKDWLVHNQIRADRYTKTIYLKEKELLTKSENGSYEINLANGCQNDNQVSTKCQPMVEKMATQYSIGKDNIKNNILDSEKTKFIKPTLEEIKNYCIERNNFVDAQHFYDYYEANGWHVGKQKMSDYKAAIRTWERNSKNFTVNEKQEKGQAWTL